MSVACAMIVRDAEDSIERCVASVRPHVSELCIYLAGESKDGTVKILDRLARKQGTPMRVVQGEWRDDFAWARERSFDLVSAEHEWIFWIDADDELRGGENLPACEQIGEANRLPYVMIAHGYNFLDGKRAYLPRARLVHRKRVYWEGIVHEDARALVQRGTLVRSAHAPQDVIRVDHQHDTAKSPGHYLPLIESATADLDRNPRACFFLARELCALGRFDEALAPLMHYLNEQHDEIEGDPNPFRLMALNLGVELTQMTDDAPMRGYFSTLHAAYAERLEALDENGAANAYLDRNDLCTCGSGRKYKKCHGR